MEDMGYWLGLINIRQLRFCFMARASDNNLPVQDKISLVGVLHRSVAARTLGVWKSLQIGHDTLSLKKMKEHQNVPVARKCSVTWAVDFSCLDPTLDYIGQFPNSRVATTVRPQQIRVKDCERVLHRYIAFYTRLAILKHYNRYA